MKLDLCWFVVFAAVLGVSRCSNVIVEVDHDTGDDELCKSAIDMINEGIESFPTPCSTVNYAVRGNRSVGNVSILNCSDDTSILVNVNVVLKAGVYQLYERLVLGYSTNITFQAAINSSPIIRCVSYPNNDTYDNIFGCSVDGLSFEGITFEECGPISSNVFIHGSTNIRFDSCIFRNNSGTSLQTRFATNIQLINTMFYNNTNERLSNTETDETTIEDLYNRVQTSGGVTIFLGNSVTSILVDNCVFENNRASKNPVNDTRPVLLKQNGHGGAILIRLNGTANATIDILNSQFINNYAEIDGGGLYVSYSELAQGNMFTFRNLTFDSNTVDEAAGGGVSVNSFSFTFDNTFVFEDCTFINNTGSAGGGFSMALYDSNLDSTETPDGIQFTRCDFISNSASNEGTAVGLFSLVHVDQVGFPVNFSDCLFQNNTSTAGKDTSAVAAFRFPTEFTDTNTFTNNVGGGIMLLNTRMLAKGTLLFDSNTAMFGGGIMMDDRCLLEVAPNVNMTFVNNYASESGGGIYVEFPPIRFVIDIFNRLCFLQYNDQTGADYPPQNWTGVNIDFIDNTAKLSGAAIYASDMQRCSWLGNDFSNYPNTLIFKPNIKINNHSLPSPFKFEGNKLEVETTNESVRDIDLATAPLNIHPSVKYYEVQPGERLAITLNATDQVNNTREAIWALDAPYRDTTLDALSADNDTYFYTVPTNIDSQSTQNETINTASITLNFSLLKTLGLSSNLTLMVDLQCHPGFLNDSGSCTCDAGNTNILRCDDDNRYIYLREGIWGTNGTYGLTTAQVLPGYTNCTQQGRLPGCLYMFDARDNQCVEGREGQLCGKCKSEYGVTLDLQSCTNTDCVYGIVLFISLSCIGLFIICFVVLWYDIPIPNELKAFIFYAQVIGLVYRPFSVVTTQSTGVKVISVIVNLLGFSNPLPLCISRTLGAEYVALFGYIPPFIILFTILGFAVGARFIRRFAHHSALKGITTLSVFFYKYIADTSFVFLSCVQTDLGFVFQYDGSVQCFSPYFGFFFVVALLIVSLFVFPLPFFVSFICFRRPQYFQAYADVLTDGLTARHLWWGGWDIGRRLPFVVISFFVVLSRPSLVLFFMSTAALVVMIVHVFAKPYKNKYTNMIEAAILLDLLLVTGAFLDPSSEQVPNWFSYSLVFLPYVYCIGYICWLIGKRVKNVIDERRPPVPQSEEEPANTTIVENASVDGSDRTTGNRTTGSSTDSHSAGNQRTNESTDNEDNSVRLREPLLEDL